MFDLIPGARSRFLRTDRLLAVAACAGAMSLVQCGSSSSTGSPGAGGNSQGGNDTGGTASDGGSGGASGSGTGGAGTGGAGGSSGTGGAPAAGGSSTGGSGAGGSAPDGGTPPDLSALPGRIAQAACNALTRCYGAGFVSVVNGTSCLEFETKILENSELSLFADAIARGTIVDSSSDVDGCLATLNADCHALESDTFCPDFFAGTIKAGDACTFNAECAKGLYCNSGTVCPGTCENRLPLNAPCTRSSDCLEALRCHGESNTCVPENIPTTTGGAGDTCNLTTLMLCQDGLACAATAISAGSPVFTCETPPTGSCHLGLPEECPAGQFCTITSSVVGSCKPIPKVGEPCGKLSPTAASSACEKGSVCDTATTLCVALAANGGSCTANDQCYSDTCQSGTCTAPKCTP